jgi:hypothetical protein
MMLLMKMKDSISRVTVYKRDPSDDIYITPVLYVERLDGLIFLVLEKENNDYYYSVVVNGVAGIVTCSSLVEI